MSQSLDTLLSKLRGPTADREFTVQPFDNRYEATVTVYEPIKATFRAVESSAREALLNALLLADRVP
jgi:hypothetical protein